MARIIYPDDFIEQKKLFNLVKNKHDADGPSSVLTAMLSQKYINLDYGLTALNQADTHNTNYIQYYKDAEENLQQRDFRADPIFSGMRGIIQYLKSYYSPNTNVLGEWGVTVDNKNRIVYPSNFDSMVILAFNIKAKHDSFPPTTSPLHTYLTTQTIDLDFVATILTDAQNYDVIFNDKRRDAETEKQLRDNLMKPIMKYLRAIGNYLVKLYRGSEQKAGDWGFTIDRSPRKPKQRNSTIGLDDQMLIKGIVINSTFTNTGTVELHVYKGSKMEGDYEIVQPGSTLGMKKGYSAIVVYNPSVSTIGKCSTLIYH